MMTKIHVLECTVECVLKELERTGYRRSTIHELKKGFARLLKVAMIMQTDTLSCELAERFVKDSAHTRNGQYCIRVKSCTSLAQKCSENTKKGAVLIGNHAGRAT